MFATKIQNEPKNEIGIPFAWDLVIEDISKSCVDFAEEEKNLLINLFRERDRFGEAKYGCRLSPVNGRNQRLDLLQELLDAIVYMRCIMYTCSMKEKTVYIEKYVQLMHLTLFLVKDIQKNMEEQKNGISD